MIILELASAGLSNLDAIRSATTVAADCLRISSAKGRLEPGMDADMVAYAENPLDNLSILREPLLVINAGKVFLRQHAIGPAYILSSSSHGQGPRIRESDQ
ncbi:MAG TPA: amidohydrolase family protein [Candidatus Aminicenantes bacterium]|nr:amidohydrolase family protein [Candidatus Aminicenantes bacterium]